MEASWTVDEHLDVLSQLRQRPAQLLKALIMMARRALLLLDGLTDTNDQMHVEKLVFCRTYRGGRPSGS
jgi:hypothetical protein